MSAATGLNQDEVNQRLINIGGFKWEGLNCKNLVGAVAKTIKVEANARALLQSEANIDQIKFAKLVWNNGAHDVRQKFITMPNAWFINLASNVRLTPVLTAALDKYQSSIGSNNPDGKAAYDDIAAKVDEWRPHVEAAKDNLFYEPQPSPGIIRMVEKFDRLQDENEGGRVPHYPNQSAVTYPFLLGKMMIAMEIDLTKDIGQIKQVIDDALKFMSLHGQRTVSAFTAKVDEADEIIGPSSGVDLKPHFQAMTRSDDFATATGDGPENKYTPNHKLTLKRIVRLVYICTKYKTVWGLMTNRAEFVEKIVELYALEDQIKTPDMNSLAMIWYLAIGRGNICAIMVDHWEKSASNELATLLGRDGQDALEAPLHVFPLDIATTTSF